MSVIVFGYYDPLFTANYYSFERERFDKIPSSQNLIKYQLINNYYIFNTELKKAYNIVIINVDPELKNPELIAEYVKNYLDPFKTNSTNKSCALHILIYYSGNYKKVVDYKRKEETREFEQHLDKTQQEFFITDPKALMSVIRYLKERDSQYRKMIENFKATNIVASNPISPSNVTTSQITSLTNVSTSPVIEFQESAIEKKLLYDFDKESSQIMENNLFTLDHFKTLFMNPHQINTKIDTSQKLLTDLQNKINALNELNNNFRFRVHVYISYWYWLKLTTVQNQQTFDSKDIFQKVDSEMYDLVRNHPPIDIKNIEEIYWDDKLLIQELNKMKFNLLEKTNINNIPNIFTIFEKFNEKIKNPKDSKLLTAFKSS